jgi:hypothetical protein
MPHKMTVTGKPVGPLCQKGSFYTFDMEESGSPSSPKGLPGGSTITYTVFLNQKQLQSKVKKTHRYFKGARRPNKRFLHYRLILCYRFNEKRGRKLNKEKLERIKLLRYLFFLFFPEGYVIHRNY